MRAIVLASIIAIAAPSCAQAKTLLETVLYVVSLHEERNNEHTRVTVEQDDHTLQSAFIVTYPQTEVRYIVTIKQIADCEFDVDHQLGVFSAHYTLDFTKSNFEDAHGTVVPNKFGRPTNAVRIPGVRYCLINGSPYLNMAVAGSCLDEFHVEHGSLKNQQKMLDTIRHLESLCIAKTS
jgi:hypothetical protein